MIDLEYAVGEQVTLLLKNPILVMQKTAQGIVPLSQAVPQIGEDGQIKTDRAGNVIVSPQPALTQLLSGKLERRESGGKVSYLVAHLNQADPRTRILVGVDPDTIEACYTYSGITVESALTAVPSPS